VVQKIKSPITYCLNNSLFVFDNSIIWSFSWVLTATIFSLQLKKSWSQHL